MPYNPGVANQSGQILANGINNTLATYAQDMLRMQENERKRAAAAGEIQGLLASDPALAGKADPALVQKLGAGKANLADTMQLLGTLNAVKSSENAALNAKLNQARIDQAVQQGEAHRMQAAQYRALLESQRRNTAAVGTAVNGPYAQPSADDPATMIQRAAANGADVDTLERLARTAETVAQARQRGAPQGMVFPNRATLEQKFPASQYDYQMTEDPRTGAITVPKVSPRGQGQAQPNKFRDALDEGLGKQVSAFIEKVPEFADTLDQSARARQALADTPITGGGKALDTFKLNAAQTINGLTGAKIFDTTSTEGLKGSIANMALTAATRLKGAGQVSDAERKLLAETVAQYGDTPQAMLSVLAFMEAKAKQQLGKAQALQQLRDSGTADPAAYQRVLTTWEKENPLDPSVFAPAAKPTAPARAAPTSGPALPPGWSIR